MQGSSLLSLAIWVPIVAGFAVLTTGSDRHAGVARIMALTGGMPLCLNGQVVGAVGVAGLSKETDTEIASTAATALNPFTKMPPQD